MAWGGRRETRIQGLLGRAHTQSVGLRVGGGAGRVGARGAEASGFRAPPPRAPSAKLQLYG